MMLLWCYLLGPTSTIECRWDFVISVCPIFIYLPEYSYFPAAWELGGGG